MPNSLRTLTLLCLLATALSVGAQTGHFFKTHYSPANEQFDYVCFDMVQDEEGMIYFATKGGIIQFDGREWDMVADIAAVFSLEIQANGKMFWAGARGFGLLSRDRGVWTSKTLSDSTVGNVFQTLIVGEQVYFSSSEKIYRLNADNTITTIISDTHGLLILRMFELFGVLYVSTDQGIYKLEDIKLSPSDLDLAGEVIFAARLKDNYIIATSDNKLQTCSSTLTMKPLPTLQDQTYLDASVIVGGSWINRQLLALGTLRGGVVFINPLNGLTQEIANYATGLPDNEVFALMADVNNNVWVAHDYGFTKVSPYLPLTAFNRYEGLEGNILCVYSKDEQVYVGTSLGLFRLEKVEAYDELVYYVNVEVRPRRNRTTRTATAPPAEVETSSTGDSKRRGLFGIFRRKEGADAAAETKGDTPAATATAEEDEAVTPTRPTYRREKRRQRILRSAQFQYKKVEGISAKITHLAESQGRLLAAGLGGLYEVDGLSSKPLLEEPVRFIFSPSGKELLIVCTYNDDVRVLRFTEHYLENTSLYSTLNDQIHYMFEATPGDLWLCGVSNIYRARVNGVDVRHRQTIPLPHPNTDKTAGALLKDRVVIAMSEGFFVFDESRNVLEKIDSVKHTKQYFAHNNNILYRDAHGWKLFDSSESDDNLHLLNVFSDIRFIGPAEKKENIWLVSGSNDLYKFFGNRITPVVKEFPLVLKSILYEDERVETLKEVIIDQEHSAVRFEVVRPDYVNPAGVEYRYLLEGMQNEWSAWSAQNNVISFPYLPDGEYTLRVQSRNIFGKISELEPVSFEVLPPYWKRPLFYAMEFSVFAMLVLLSFRLSTRFRIISRLLSLLTIILLIEFIQTAINATFVTEESPVIDFFIQVVVAFMILPVEGYLRNLMLRSLDASGKFYKFLVPGKPTVMFKGKPEKFVRETTKTDS